MLLAAAELSHNYSDPVLLEVTTYDHLVSMAETQKRALGNAQKEPDRANGASAIKWPAGPGPFEVVDVREAPDGKTAAVEICYSSYWTVTTSRKSPRLNLDTWTQEVLMRRGLDGHIRAYGIGDNDSPGCDSQKEITGGLFDPPVVAPKHKEVKPGDVKFPLKAYAPTATDS